MLILKNYRAMLIITFLLATLCLNSKPYEKYETMLSDFKNLSVDSSKVYSVTNFTIKKEDAEIILKSGTFYFCKPINGRCMAAVYIGDGNFNFTPRTKVETRQLFRILEKDSIRSQLKAMFILFADNIGDKIEKAGLKTSLSPQQKPEDILKKLKEYELDYKKNNIGSAIAQTLLNDKHNDVFYSMLQLEGTGDLFYQFNPYDKEEVQLLRGDWDALDSYTEPVNQYQSKAVPQNNPNNNKDIIKIDKYKMNITIESDLEFKTNATIDVTILDTNFKWVPFYLDDKLFINSIKLSDGTSLPFYKSEKSSDLWVKFPDNTKQNTPLTLLMDYHGDILTRSGDYTFMNTSIGWYPSTGYKQMSQFDLTFTTPNNYKFTCVGDLLSTEKVNKTIVTHWVTPYIIRNASFSIGSFDQKKFESNGFQNLEIFYVSSKQLESVMSDAALSLEFYSKIFGPVPPKKIIISELPAYFGEAFPGLIHLSHLAFLVGSGAEGHYEQFCAHEMAHQWWGINVDFESYHDQWLSEGFAEYSSLLYLQAVMEDKGLFLDFLKDYKKDLTIARKSFLGNGVRPGPISLGYRNNSTKTKGDYDLVIYKKGAWVFQMLRNLMLDINTMKEDKFLTLIKEFYKENVGKTVSTADFQKKAEDVMDEDLGWFFDQWVDDYKIPKYKFAYKTEKTEAGLYKVSCRVEQSEVPADFKMDVILKIDFGNNKSARLRKHITGELTEFELPLLDKKPKDIIFNDLESVLCEVDNVGW